MAFTISAGLIPDSPLEKWIDKWTYLEITYFILNALINVVLTLMVAGKIWSSSRQSDEFVSSNSKERYASIAAIIFQSGLLYPLVLAISVPFMLSSPLAGWNIYPLQIQFAGICPTLMIARVGLGDTWVRDKFDLPSNATVAKTERPRPVIDIVELQIGKNTESW
ncbi:hypothetical protein PM082_019782 [Marasmius tenuissimus]|nr:hypothetical protein PM082_019782 [Marasmius tenuissimus]